MAIKINFSATLVAALLSSSSYLGAEEKKENSKPAPGHSHVGESFDEGPRQAAIKIEGTGNVSFPVTTNWVKGQAMFNQGMGQLHGFWYYEAERTFREIVHEILIVQWLTGEWLWQIGEILKEQRAL